MCSVGTHAALLAYVRPGGSLLVPRMKPAPLRPKLHVFACSNVREAGSPLGPGCSAIGDQVFASLKRAVAKHGLTTSVWITRTSCLGLCPKRGSTVAVYPPGTIYVDVQPEDADAIVGMEPKGTTT